MLFDYTTFLKNSEHIAKAENAALVGSTTAADYYAAYTSAGFTDPSDAQMFYSLINPGHTGTTFAIQYVLKILMYTVVDSYKWQIKASGGAWADLTTAKAATGTTIIDVGIYTTPVLLPAEVQLLVTDAGSSYVLQIGLAYPCSVRCIGTL
uniref:Uncharacterized protein n=1 Tax=viral metagenome TaxID=1070528 RepID=A0A6M3KQR0_9ZZZZ